MSFTSIGRPIEKVLVANRGEIAVRIFRACTKLGKRSVAIYSEQDERQMFRQKADESYLVGKGLPPVQAYLNIDDILRIAKDNNVDAIHPGYGFLSERADFAQACNDNGIKFIGPTPETISRMGNKLEARKSAIEAGVPVVPGTDDPVESVAQAKEFCRQHGLPVIFKAAFGGGGKGMRVVREFDEIEENFRRAQSEAQAAFGNGSMFIERFIERPRHIEVQVIGDEYGNVVHLFDRDCSVQRRHQKIIEEAPAPLISDETRQELGAKAVAAAKAVAYQGAGTVEFLFDKTTGKFFFMEMNTRLQVEHPITEMITGIDLVEWQLLVASGEPLPRKQTDIHITGHAFEARICAENPQDNFLPQTGRLDYVQQPDLSTTSLRLDPSQAAVRLDTGFSMGDTISPYYDSMIAKLVVCDKDRRQALRKLNSALGQYVILGVPTNIDFLTSLTENRSFQEANVGTDFIDEHHDELFSETQKSSTETAGKFYFVPEICAVIYKLMFNKCTLNDDLLSYRTIHHRKPVYKFKMNLPGSASEQLEIHYESIDLRRGNLTVIDPDSGSSFRTQVYAEWLKPGYTIMVKLNQGRDTFKLNVQSPSLTDTGNQETLVVINRSGGNKSHLIGVECTNCFRQHQAGALAAGSSDPSVALAPMPGIIERVLVKEGDEISEGQSLIIMSAMKMEYTIKALTGGALVEAINCQVGDFVAKDLVLARLRLA